jgi:hypothetical protein
VDFADVRDAGLFSNEGVVLGLYGSLGPLQVAGWRKQN